MIIDEIHLLHDERGPVLESVARAIRRMEQTGDYVRLTSRKGLFYFDASYRPCGLQQLSIGVTEKKAMKRFQVMNEETAKTAKFIRDMAIKKELITQFVRPDSAMREILQEEAGNVKDSNFRDLLPFGFTNPSRVCWLHRMQIYAGRPQYDTYVEGIIITNHSELQYYLSLMNQQLHIESQFVSKLADNLNAEIVLGTVRNRDKAVQWLGYTYLLLDLYGVGVDYQEDDDGLVQKRADIVHSAAALLEKCHLIKYERSSGRFQSTELGRIASHYYVTHNSMATYNQHLRPTMSTLELFRVFALLNEFELLPMSIPQKSCCQIDLQECLKVRQEEKLELAKLLERVPIPVKESVDEPAAKINVLLQAYISSSLRATSATITCSLLRIDLSIVPDFRWDEKIHGGAEMFFILIEDVDGEISSMMNPSFVSVVSDRWLHAETRLPISFKHLILPEKFPPPTPLLELQPLPLSALHNKEYEAIYSNTIQTIHKIQTQVFQALYTSDENVFVGAPTGSGRTICAEFALLKLWNKGDNSRAVCVGPH
ncbi:Sec63 Brl domain-containing protein [Boletus edulis BED1]|uniref:Sec63 Brl domain-containing protein n=1 Tax=Boletus edulis BED1 TaxID=1328754 RepID=A0AAD4BSP8_BOLED|nr:Sec63 Brl domain-containing protein [Boletus edulis BED1]